MLSKFLAAAALGSALIAAPALAQTSTMSATTGPQSASAAGWWQGSKIIGLNVYNPQNQKIGSIVQLMVDKSGNIQSVVIGVGGFLGMGERDVAVKFADLTWSNQPVRSTSSSAAPPPGMHPTTMRPPTTTGAATASSSSGPRTYPDHAVLNATKDQLKAMPQFDYNK